MANESDSGLWYDYSMSKTQSATNPYATTDSKANSALDKDAFLRLLLTQLQYQDPLNPVDDKEFIAQMAQFTSLEQMTNMNKATLQTQAFSMIGKDVYANVYNNATSSYNEVYGTVTSVLMKSGETYLVVNDGTEVPLSSVIEVYSGSGVGSAQNTATSQALSLIGKYIQAVTFDDKFNPKEFVEGKVDYVKFDAKGNPILMIGDVEVYPREVTSVAEGMRLVGKTISVEDKISGEPITGTIVGVQISDDEAYLLLSGSKAVPIKKINLVSDALGCVNTEIKYGEVSGKVSSVIIRDGIPYLVVGDKEVSYAAYKGITITDD